MYQYAQVNTQRVMQPTMKIPQAKQSFVIPLDKSSIALQSTRRVSQNIDQTISNVSPIRLISNKTQHPISPHINQISQFQQNQQMTPQKVQFYQRQNLTPQKSNQQQVMQQRNLTPNIIQPRQTMNPQNQSNQRVHTETGFSTPIQYRKEKENNDFSNDKMQTQYQNLQEQLIQSEFKISQLEQKSRQLQEQRKKLQQQFLQKSPKLAQMM